MWPRGKSCLSQHAGRPPQRAPRRRLATLITLALACALLPVEARAQMGGARALRAVSVTESDDGWTFELELDFPARFRRFVPASATRVLRIEIDPIQRGGDELPSRARRENLPLDRATSGPLADAFYSGTDVGTAVIELQFSQTLVFRVDQKRGLRSLTVHAARPAVRRPTDAAQAAAATAGAAGAAGAAATSTAGAAATSAASGTTGAGAGAAGAATGAAAPSAGAAAVADDEKVSALVVRARHAIRDGELDLAIALLTRVFEQPPASVSNATRMEARELLGLTHERRGQLAHAAAEYEAYLAEQPAGPGADRVRQRLEAIRTASGPRVPARRTAIASEDGASAGVLREAFGSIGARYYRTQAHEDDTGLDFSASDLLTDVNATGRVETDRWELRGDFVGTYDHALEGDGRTDDVRVSRLSGRFDDRVHGVETTVGRQRRSDGGVLGRFDGVHSALRLSPVWRLSALAGMPIERWSDNLPTGETWVFGGSVDFDDLWVEGLQGQVFVVGQRAYSMTDRTALGGEFRFTNDRSHSFVYFDYDFVFQTLNTVLASTTWRLDEQTDLRASFERRNAPIVTLSAALQGQEANDLDELRKTLSESDIRDLALDRTAVAYTGMVGGTHRLSDTLQLSGDFAVNHIGATDTADGVDGAEANGPDFGTTIGLLASDWPVENAVGSVTLRYFEGEMYRSFMALLFTRFVFIRTLRASPKLRLEWRESDLQGQRSRLRPSLELGWRRGAFSLFGEGGGEWEEPITSGNGASRELGYFLEVGVRWDF